jgi:tRNA(Arg) A34 adenosine deaminase TadA
MDHENYMDLAIEEAKAGMRAGEGGPFGAVIVRDGQIIGKAHNTVLLSHDPTAHAEVNAIRDACSREGTHHLKGAVIYSNFEPCPMCLAAMYWACIRELYFAAGREDAEAAGFMDRQLYDELALPNKDRKIRSTRLTREAMKDLMEEWGQKGDRILY